MSSRMATRSRTRAAVAEPPLSPLLSERSVLLHEHAHAPLGGQFPPEVSDDDVWLPVAARDDVDDGGDIEYLAVLASAVQHGIQVEPRHTTFAVLGQHMMVALQYHGEDWQPVVMNDDVDDVDDREYLGRLNLAVIDWQEEERRARLAALVRQTAAEDSVPLLERACVICMDALGAPDHGPVVQLDCHASHRFHAECLARAWAGRSSRPCPCCRRPSQLGLTLDSYQQWRVARRVHDERVASEWEAHSAWRDMPPCMVAAAPPPRTHVLDHARVPGEWHAIDCVSVVSCVLSPCTHISDVPSNLRVDWARARSEVLLEIQRAREQGATQRRLFGDGTPRADSAEGVQQGCPLSSLAFAVGIHPELQGLDAELAPFGGAARAIMDDIYAVGPPSVVFPAVQRFRLTLHLLTGLVSNVAKFVCFSHTHDLERCPWRADAQVPLGGESGDLLGGGRGVMVAGVPVGDDVFVRSRVCDIASGVVSYIHDTAARLRDHPQALWSALYYGCQSRFDYWLRHVAPRFVIDGARLIDAALLEVCEQLTYGGCLREPLTLCRVRLPGRMGGCGLRARSELAYVAYAACVAETVPRLVGPLRANVTGQSNVGFFPSLARFFATHGGIGMRGFVACGSFTAAYFRAAWEHLQSLVQGSGVEGPLNRHPHEAEDGGSMRLQRAITVHLETVQRDRLHARLLALPQSDTRRVSWLAADRFSSQWVSAWPSPTCELSDLEFPEVFTTYLGRPSPALRCLVGRNIPCGRVSGRVCDAHGHQLGMATLPGNDNVECHDACGRELLELLREAKFAVQLQPRYIFHSLIPLPHLLSTVGGRPPAIIPDAAIDVALPAVGAAHDQRQGQPLPIRRLLFDVKTIHGGTAHYSSAAARSERGGAVRHRAAAVAHDYTSHARALDARFYPGTTEPGPIMTRLRSFTQVRGLVFGNYGEASTDVHDLVTLAASKLAGMRWQLAGARSATEMRAFLVSRCRRRIGLATVQAMARHRLARLPYIGVPRAVVQAQLQRGPRMRGEPVPYAPAPSHADFYSYQAWGSEAAVGA